jgi:hypothetical protein
MLSSLVNITAGKWYLSTNLEATIPKTPECHLGLYKTKDLQAFLLIISSAIS